MNMVEGISSTTLWIGLAQELSLGLVKKSKVFDEKKISDESKDVIHVRQE